jgi:hypothetical protein
MLMLCLLHIGSKVPKVALPEGRGWIIARAIFIVAADTTHLPIFRLSA